MFLKVKIVKYSFMNHHFEPRAWRIVWKIWRFPLRKWLTRVKVRHSRWHGAIHSIDEEQFKAATPPSQHKHFRRWLRKSSCHSQVCKRTNCLMEWSCLSVSAFELYHVRLAPFLSRIFQNHDFIFDIASMLLIKKKPHFD